MPELINHFIRGPVGQLETIVQVPRENESGAVAVLCHPLPTAGGSMHNKVIHTLNQAFAKLGISTIRWNTRGTGASEGAFDDGRGEIDDLAAVIEYARSELDADRIWLAGFSFGSAVAFGAARDWNNEAQQIQLQQLILLAPPVSRYDYQLQTEQLFPLLLIQGAADEVVDPADTDLWYQHNNSLFSDSEYIYMDDTSHFFHGRLIELREHLNEQIVKP